MVNIGEEAVTAPEGLVTSVGFSALGKVYYAFEGNIHCTGATIKWMVEKLGLVDSFNQIETLATSVKNMMESIWFRLLPDWELLGGNRMPKLPSGE